MRYISKVLFTKIIFGSIAALIDIVFALQLENIFVSKLMIQPTITGVLVGSLAAGFALFISSMISQYLNRNTKYFNIWKPFADIWGTILGALIISFGYFIYLKEMENKIEAEKIERGEKLISDKVIESDETKEDKERRLMNELETERINREMKVRGKVAI